MKKNTLILILLLNVNFVYSQEVKNIPHCNCEDKFDTILPEINGKYKRVCSNILIEEGEFINGVKHGEWIIFSQKGKIIRKMNFDNGLLNGPCEIYFLSGQKKLEGSFKNGQKSNKWTYFNAKGKILIEGEYASNKPIGNWVINDKKGKKPIYQYNFDSKTYGSKKAIRYFEDNDLVQNSNTEEWFILRNPNKKYSSDSKPLGGFDFFNDLLIEYLEVPIDFWDTYVYNNYEVIFNLEDDNSLRLKLLKSPSKLNSNVDDLTFLIVTNPTEKIQKINHSDLNMKFLEMKIYETLSFLPPWIKGEESEVKLNLHYVINQNLH